MLVCPERATGDSDSTWRTKRLAPYWWRHQPEPTEELSLNCQPARHTRGAALSWHQDPPASRLATFKLPAPGLPVRGFGMFAFCCPVHMRRAAPRPLPVPVPKLSPSYLLLACMLMTDGCHCQCQWRPSHVATGTHTAIVDSWLMIIRPLLRSWPISALQLARRGGRRRATADLSKRIIIAGCGPHVLRH
jgi:hypothetical protein